MAMMTCLEDSITFRYSVVIEKKDLFLKIEEDRKLIMENFTSMICRIGDFRELK